MAEIQNISNPLELATELAKMEDAQVIGQIMVQQGAVHAVSFLLNNGCQRDTARSMLDSLRANAAVVRAEAVRRGITDPFPQDQLAAPAEPAAPVATAAHRLRAMATNYPAGHLWDRLDAKACIQGALELEALRKKVATYEARDALGLMPQPAGALGPDGKEWAKTAAGYAHVEAMLPRADGQGRGPFWYGWALRGAFVAGAEWQEGREQLEMAAGAVHVATASPPPSNTLWRLLTNGYDFEFVNQLGDAHPEKSVLIDRATKNWQQICAEVASLRTTTAMSDAARDLLAERARQVQEEGWTPEHDDEHSNGEMAEAAACYAGTAHAPLSLKRRQCSGHWPWAAKWWKPSDARRDLIKAGALILAEIERMDRNGKTEPQDKAA